MAQICPGVKRQKPRAMLTIKAVKEAAPRTQAGKMVTLCNRKLKASSDIVTGLRGFYEAQRELCIHCSAKAPQDVVDFIRHNEQ